LIYPCESCSSVVHAHYRRVRESRGLDSRRGFGADSDGSRGTLAHLVLAMDEMSSKSGYVSFQKLSIRRPGLQRRGLPPSLDSLYGRITPTLNSISDNASTDAPEEICRGYAAKDDRIVLSEATNIGASGKYNRVFETGGAGISHGPHDDVHLQDVRRVSRCLTSPPNVRLVAPGVGNHRRTREHSGDGCRCLDSRQRVLISVLR